MNQGGSGARRLVTFGRRVGPLDERDTDKTPVDDSGVDAPDNDAGGLKVMMLHTSIADRRRILRQHDHVERLMAAIR